MADIQEIVQVTISQQTAAVSRAGFGVPLILGENATFEERIRFYTGIAGVAEDFATDDEEYLAAAAILGQTPRPARIAIGKKDANVAKVMTITLDDDLVASNKISVTVNGELVEHTFATDHQTSMTAFAAAIDAIDGVASAVLSGAPYRVITVTATSGRTLTLTGATITGGASQADVVLATTEAGYTVADGIQDVRDESDDWYALILTSRAEADQLTAAAAIEPMRKIFLAADDAAGIIASTTTDVLAKLEALAYNRTAFWYHGTDNAYIEAAVAGRCLPTDPGSETWAFKTLAGVSADALTTTQSQNVRVLKSGNTYETIAGLNVTREGQMVSGRFIDQTRFIDWLEARLQERIFTILIQNDKIPYTNAGVALIEAGIRAVLRQGVDAGGLDPDSIEVSVPDVADVDSTDRGNRLLPDVTFSARLTGGIHNIEISGVVTI